MTAYVPGITETDPKKIVRAIQQLASGRVGAAGRVTLATDAPSTVVMDNNCAAGSVPVLVPATANAAVEVGNGTMFISAVTDGSFTIAHANAATAGRTFLYALIG
jgi:hypothetical protein